VNNEENNIFCIGVFFDNVGFRLRERSEVVHEKEEGDGEDAPCLSAAEIREETYP
jgi:hypothetical protein